MLSAILNRSTSERAVSVPWDTGWGEWPGSTGSVVGGVKVDQLSAAQLLAVYGSASLITDEISTLPVEIDGRTRRPQWVDHPSEDLDRIAWLGQIVWSLLLEGNAYLAQIGPIGAISALDPLDPCKVSIVREGGRKVYYVNGQRPMGFTVVHIPGRMRPGDLKGMSPVEESRQSIGLGLAAQRYGSEFFENEGKMPGVIEVPGDVQPKQLTEIAQQWRRLRRSGGRGLPGVLKAGAVWKSTGVTNEQAQFLATRQFTAAEIAGQMFHLDPSDLGIPVTGTSMTYGNLQQRVADRTQKALMPWIRRIEAQLSELLVGGATYRFDVDSRLRGNTRESYETLGVAVAAGFMTANEARIIIGLPEIDELEPVAAAAVAPVDDEETDMRALFAEVAEIRAASSAPQSPTINITNTPPAVEVRNEFTMPDIDVDARQEPPVVNVTTPDVVVNVPAPEVVEARAVRKTIEHTADGRIAAIIEEPV